MFFCISRYRCRKFTGLNEIFQIKANYSAKHSSKSQKNLISNNQNKTGFNFEFGDLFGRLQLLNIHVKNEWS